MLLMISKINMQKVIHTKNNLNFNRNNNIITKQLIILNSLKHKKKPKIVLIAMKPLITIVVIKFYLNNKLKYFRVTINH